MDGLEFGRTPVQLTHSEYHTATRRLSGSIAVSHGIFTSSGKASAGSSDAMAAADVPAGQRVYVRASFDNGATFKDYEAQRLFEGFGGAGADDDADDADVCARDFFAFSIKLMRQPRRTLLALKRSAKCCADLPPAVQGGAPVMVRFMVVCEMDGVEWVDDNEGRLYSVVLHD